jgi:ABC-type multidrug transport system fused ATPase/permease subunit
MEQTFGLLDRKSSLSDDGKLLYDSSEMGTDITLENVKFTYPGGADRPILNGVDLDIKGGKTVALVGSSGCGKSTILRLLYRFYDPTNDDGTITVGSHKLSALKTESLRRSIAVVPQDTVLFHESIGYNIHYGNLDSPWEDVIDAAKKAKIHDTIMSFQDGYDTVVGERGLKLSGGEKQ